MSHVVDDQGRARTLNSNRKIDRLQIQRYRAILISYHSILEYTRDIRLLVRPAEHMYTRISRCSDQIAAVAAILSQVFLVACPHPGYQSLAHEGYGG